jgi:hypothetical protein
MGFEKFDRSAVHGAYLHRDSIWLTHLAAAFAVFAAVCGFLHFWPFRHGHGWAVTELILLGIIVFLIQTVRWRSLQQRWITVRLAAEHLRIARLCLPLLLLPPALRGTADKRAEKDFAAEGIAAVKRVVREQGVPEVDLTRMDPVAAALWVELIVADQAAYHRGNEAKLHHAEKGLYLLTNLAFGLAVAGVLFHFGMPQADWLLLPTAAGPAFAAALHGAGNRLGIVHRLELSRSVKTALDDILAGLRSLDTGSPGALARVRGLALDAAEIMGAENTDWHHLVRRQEDHLP